MTLLAFEFSFINIFPFFEDAQILARVPGRLGMRQRHLGQDGHELPGLGQGRQRTGLIRAGGGCRGGSGQGGWGGGIRR